MLRSFIFSIVVVSGLSVFVPLLPNPTEQEPEVQFHLSQPEQQLDIEKIRGRSRSRAIKMATEQELNALRQREIADLIHDLGRGSERERALAAAVLGASTHQDAVDPLIHAFEQERDPTLLGTLALSLAETRDPIAIRTLVSAIRHRGGLHAYEACRALKQIYGLNLGLNADAWERWLAATTHVPR